MRKVLALLSLCLFGLTCGVVPHHIQTADYFGGYAGTHRVAPEVAARWLSWAETDNVNSLRLLPLGVKTLEYTNPYVESVGDPLYSKDESMYVHRCNGARLRLGNPRFGITDPNSPILRSAYIRSVRQRESTGHFTAFFEDEALLHYYGVRPPCNYNENNRLNGMIALQRAIGYPVVYNALEDFDHHSVAREIALNSTAIGGMMEDCYSTLDAPHTSSGWRWLATEQTEIDMARDGKYFFCYGRDLTPADQAIQQRLYVYASLLLTYDLSSTVLWEYYKTPSGEHVMPETQLVALDPIRTGIHTISQLRAVGGAYVREYRKCYIDGFAQGACVAAVNADSTSHRMDLSGYSRILAIDGSGQFDGGKARVIRQNPPSVLNPGSAVIAFR